MAFCRRVVAGERDAIEALYRKFEEPLKASMMKRGGTHAQDALDSVDEVLGECSAPYVSKKGVKCLPRLAGYRGGAPLGALLHEWCRCRLLDKVKRRKPIIPIGNPQPGDDETDDHAIELPSPTPKVQSGDREIIQAVHDCLRQSLEEANPEGVVLMRLAFLFQIPGNQLARIWGLDPANISRRIRSVLKEIKESTLEALHEYDPELDLTWEEILAMGEGSHELLWDDVPAL